MVLDAVVYPVAVEGACHLAGAEECGDVVGRHRRKDDGLDDEPRREAFGELGERPHVVEHPQPRPREPERVWQRPVCGVLGVAVLRAVARADQERRNAGRCVEDHQQSMVAGWQQGRRVLGGPVAGQQPGAVRGRAERVLAAVHDVQDDRAARARRTQPDVVVVGAARRRGEGVQRVDGQPQPRHAVGVRVGAERRHVQPGDLVVQAAYAGADGLFAKRAVDGFEAQLAQPLPDLAAVRDVHGVVLRPRGHCASRASGLRSVSARRAPRRSRASATARAG
jgi:hypothetical protein